MKQKTRKPLAALLLCALLFSCALAEEPGSLESMLYAQQQEMIRNAIWSAPQTPSVESILFENRKEQLFVAPWGSDENDGTEEAPLRTLEAAIEAARMYGLSDGTIWLRGGRYEMYGTVRIDGAFPENVSIRAYPGEQAEIVGSDRIMGFAETTLCGVKVWQADVPYSELNALYADDGARQNARYPKTGMLQVANVEAIDGGLSSAASLKRFRAFYAEPGELPFDPTGCRIRLLHWWKDECTTVSKYIADMGYVLLNRRTSATIGIGDFYYFENVLDMPMEPGEWAFDVQAHQLYYCPKPGENIENTPLYAGVLTRLLDVSKVRNIAFEGITFTQTGWNYTKGNLEPDFAQAAYDAESMLCFSDCEGVSFINCTFRDTGGGCIRFGSQVKSAVVTDCDFQNIGAQAIFIEGKNLRDDALANTNFTITNNLVDGYGRVFLNAPAILVIHARYGVITHNTIRDGYYTAISAGWVWGDGYSATDYWTISDNLIENIGQGMLSDMGGIYLLGSQKHTVIEENLIRSVHHAPGGYGGRALFLDEGADGVTVRRNLCYDCSSQAYFQHNAGTNTLIENVFAYCWEGQVGLSDNDGEGTVVMERNVLVGEEPHVVVVGSTIEGALGDYRDFAASRPKVKQTGTVAYNAALGESPFFNPSQGNYSLIIDASLAEAGFADFSLDVGCTRLEGLPAGIVQIYEQPVETPMPQATDPAPQAAAEPEPQPVVTSEPAPSPQLQATPAPTDSSLQQTQVDVWVF